MLCLKRIKSHDVVDGPMEKYAHAHCSCIMRWLTRQGVLRSIVFVSLHWIESVIRCQSVVFETLLSYYAPARCSEYLAGGIGWTALDTLGRLTFPEVNIVGSANENQFAVYCVLVIPVPCVRLSCEM